MSSVYFIIAVEDYNATDFEGMILVNTSQSAALTIQIVDDDLLELNETFQVEIGLLDLEDSNCVILQPNVANVTILDNDSK